MKPTLPVIFVLFLCYWMFAAAAIETRASTLTVTKTADTNDGICDADCSLREAVTAAASGDTVVFSTLFNTPQTITLTLGQITISKNLTINGNGGDLVAISGANAARIFEISGGGTVNLSGMIFRDGNVQLQTGVAFGGAIRVIDNTALNVSTATFTNNRTASPDGSQGSAIACGGPMTLSNLVVVGNSLDSPAIAGTTMTIRDSLVRQNNGGGINAITVNVERCVISNNTGEGVSGQYLTVTDSTINNNTDGGIYSGDGESNLTIERCVIRENSRNAGAGGVLSGGTATIKDSQIINNTARSQGGGIVNGKTLYLINSVVSGNNTLPSIFGDDGGGGIWSNAVGALFVINSTISGNTAVGNPGVGGGIYSYYADGGGGAHVYFVNSTVANNTSAGGGGGIRIDPGNDAKFSNSIVANNTSTGTNQEDMSGTIISNGNNLIGNPFGSFGWIASDLLNIDPILEPLADYGGGTMTHALLPGSPAINAGNNAVAIDPQTQMPLIKDQRGFLRASGRNVDIGAFEVQPVITGTVTYGNATGSSTPRFVSGVLLSAVGSPNVTAMSRADGTYTLGGFGSGAYTVTPSKTGGANGISSFDAGLIAKHVAGLQVLAGNQLIVADVSGNGTLSSFDAGQVARYTVGISGFGLCGTWKFIPASRTYPSVNSTLAGEDFVALLMGDVSGNWTNTGARQNK